MARARGSFEVTSWEEETYEEMDDGGKLTQASVAQTFSGDIEGEGAAQWLMSYRADGTAHFVGLQRVRATVAERRGVFVLETIGEFDGKVARWAASVVERSGTGGLRGLTGSGTFEAPDGPQAFFELDYEAT
ncbi:MAG: DUF3224 domain-containing protein [Chloroflexi bacterium]|nr:DUF3224 domain-containing protein [Chloroflexota bacterium]